MALNKNRMASRIEDYLLYIGIGVGLVAVLVAVAFSVPKGEDVSPRALNWIGFAGVTALAYGETIRTRRRSWRSGSFWAVVALALGVQLGAGALVLWHAPRVSTLVWGFLFPMNLVVLDAFLNRFSAPTRVRGAAQQGDAADKRRL